MRAVRRKDTAPEMRVRKLLHAAGYRYRLHVQALPGSPDIVFPGRKMAIFVHGCFWHGHSCKRGASRPKSNAEFWAAKIERNATRDAANVVALRQLGWGVLVVWECEVKDRDAVLDRLNRFLAQGLI